MDRHKVLVVDDDQDLLRGLTIRLRAHGYDVIQAADCIHALAAALKDRPQLILLDIGLPGGDGYLVMERMQSLGSIAATPVIVLTARDPATERDRAMAAGAVGFYQKPVDNERLISAIKHVLD